MIKCPDCGALLSQDQIDKDGHCTVCGNKLLAPPDETVRRAPAREESFPDKISRGVDVEEMKTRSQAPEAPPVREEPFPYKTSRGGVSEVKTRIHDPEAPSARKAPTSPPLPPVTTSEPERERMGWDTSDREEEERRQTDYWSPKEGRDSTKEGPASHSTRAATVPYEALVADVERRLREGFEYFSLVGHPGSGKTHFLKALTYLLDRHGVGGEKATTEFKKAATPGSSGAAVADYSYTGPGGEKWVIVDPGGELYLHLQRNDWGQYGERSVRLSRWLHQCHGLFCFLHLNPDHFKVHVTDLDPALAQSAEEEQALAAKRNKLQDAKRELEFFRNFFLFLRALKARGGDIKAVIEQCRRNENLEEALRDYHEGTPRLDLPVMFFFTQADRYTREDVAITSGVYANPRTLDLPATVFTARYLPSLFAGVSSQVERFKFDFLQSYEDHPLGRRNEQGEPLFETYFQDPGDNQQLLSVGLAAGVEFVLRNQPRPGGEKRLMGIATLPALRLHRRLHPGLWKGVPTNLLSTGRRVRGGGT